jgi:hypothetical protein
MILSDALLAECSSTYFQRSTTSDGKSDIENKMEESSVEIEERDVRQPQ